MVQYFTETGEAIPATVILAGPIVVTQIKNKETDGYEAVQVGYGTQKESRLTKAVRGHLGTTGFSRHLKEFRGIDMPALEKGATLDASVFSKGDMVTITGVSKGKGFQGVVKRHGFHGGPRSHGQKHSEREPGSIGGGLRNRVPKGMRMAGRMGSDTVTIKNMTILDVDAENNQLLVKGAIPGRKGTVVKIVG